jgi:ubiquinol-cytochrome c reductase cytochrome c1 subunit
MNTNTVFSKALALAAVLLGLAGVGGLGTAQAAGANLIAWDKAPHKTNDMASLQNGAKLFVNYCMGCHSAAYVRYNRLRDIGVPEQQIKDNLLFATANIGETMKNAMDPKNAKDWFGGVPPDLSLVARSRASGAGSGPDYLYTLLRSYYRDDTKVTGWNNLAYPNIGMPNPLWQLQGERQPIFNKVKDSHGHEVDKFAGYTVVKAGQQSQLDYDNTVADLVGYMTWMGEPGQSQRQRLGVWVLLFLACFTFIAWRLNASYWKDIK